MAALPSTGAPMPLFGLGTWKSGPGEVKVAVEHALKSGYAHIDAAAIYGNEAEVGAGIAAAGTARSDFFLTSKLWNTKHNAADVEPACRETLANLGVGYLDLYLIHWPVSLKPGHAMPPEDGQFDRVPLEETWQAMCKLKDLGLVKHVGVSNFSIAKIERLLKAGLPLPDVNQVEMHPYLQQPKLVEYCKAKGIVVTAYSPLGSPDRPARVLDASDPVLTEDPTLAKIAEQEGRAPADVLIRWSVQRGVVVIPKSVTPARIESNLAASQKPLSPEAMEQLAQMDRGLRLLKGLLWVHPSSEYTTLAELWDE